MTGLFFDQSLPDRMKQRCDKFQVQLVPASITTHRHTHTHTHKEKKLKEDNFNDFQTCAVSIDRERKKRKKVTCQRHFESRKAFNMSFAIGESKLLQSSFLRSVSTVLSPCSALANMAVVKLYTIRLSFGIFTRFLPGD